MSNAISMEIRFASMRPFPTQVVPVFRCVFTQTISASENSYAFPPFVLVGPLLKFLSPVPCSLPIITPDLRVELA